MKQQITLTEVGYAHLSQANWSYGVWAIADETGIKLYKETFGGEHRAMDNLKKEGKKAKICYVPQNGKFGVREVEKLEDIENYLGQNYSK